MKKKGAFVIILILLLAAAGVTVTFIVLNSGTYTWYVEEGLEEHWGRVLSSAPPPGKYRIRTYTGDEKQLRAMQRTPGILITTRREQTPGKVKVYYALSFELEYEGALVLALDPWMVFRKHMDPALAPDRVHASGEGRLLIPGGEPEALEAWAARLLQEGAGKFPEDPALWLEAEKTLFDENRFPVDAPVVGWPNVLSRLLSGETAWLYAPLSVIRAYSESRTSILEASAFPENAAPGSQISMQAKLLWAIPAGTDKQKEELQETITWLKDPAAQTVIADELQWIPAAPYGIPYNPVSMTSYLAWLTTAYIYELP
jgi:hypothetical protein